MDLEYTPILDEGGTPMGVLASVLDITARVLGERRMAASESRLLFLDRLARPPRPPTMPTPCCPPPRARR